MVITFIRLFLLFFFGFILARSDLKKNIIPDKITLPLIGIGIILNFIEYKISLLLIYSYLILLGTYFFYLILYIVLKAINSIQTIGGGDVKYSLAIASLVPFSKFFIYNIFIVKVIFISFIFMFSMSVVKFLALLIYDKLPKKSKLIISSTILDTKVTFAPLLFISSILAWFI